VKFVSLAKLDGRIWRSTLLVFVAAIEVGTPFIRMIVLARLLDLGDVGFSVALGAVYATLLQVTDISINRFVFSTPREEYAEAIAAGHGLSVLRGVALAVFALVAAPWLSQAISGGRGWLSYAFLGPILLGRSFEHLGPRVAERDYKYGAQLKANLISNGCGLAALSIVAILWRSPNAILAFLLAQSASWVLASHRYSTTKYELRFGGPYFVRAWRFAYPLMFNGAGLAVTQQGDRLMVASVLGLPALGLYSTAIMAAWLPITLLIRVMNTINMATLFNASADRKRFTARLRLYARATPLIAAAYAIVVLTFINLGISIAFGHKYVMDPWMTAVLAGLTFLSIVRVEPFTDILLHEMMTARLAAINLSTVFGLAASTALALAFRSLTSTIAGRVIGEVVSLCMGVYLTRDLMRGAWLDFGASFALSLILVLGAITAHLGLFLEAAPEFRPAVLSCFLVCVAGSAALALPGLLRAGYTRRRSADLS
jgi:O-antigen/teichoic acid export membrane protein